MIDKHVPPSAFAFSGVILAIKPDSPTVAVAFVAAACLFGWVKWLDHKREIEESSLESEIKDIKSKVDSLMIARGLGR